MKTLHLVLWGAVAFLAGCGVNPNPTPAQPQTDPSQTDQKLSPLVVGWKNVTVVASGYSGGEVSMVLDADSRPVISYSSASGDLTLVYCGNTTCSSGNLIHKVDKGGQFHSINSMVLDATGRPVITYSSHENITSPSFPQGYDVLKLVHCGYTDCSGGNIFKILDDSYPASQYGSLALDAAGKPVVSMEFPIDLHVEHCGDANCSAIKLSPALDREIGDSSLALDSRGYPVVGYVPRANWDNPNPSLKLVHCGNANCTSGSWTQTVDNGAIVAQSPSLVLDSVGRPVMAYYDAAKLDLKLVHCGNANCSSGNFTTVVEGYGDVGMSPSLKLDANGKPVIAHYDRDFGTVKLVRCGNINCSSNNVSERVGNTGVSSAIQPSLALALDANGLAVVAYGAPGGGIQLARQLPNNLTPPTVTPTITGTLGNDGYYTSNVTLGWALVGNGSAITDSKGCDTITFSTDVLTTIACTATNGGGTTQQTVTIKRDATKPVLHPTVNPNPILQYLSATVTPNASDALSGLTSRDCATATTDRVGSFSVICTAKDFAGNSNTVAASYTVISASQGIANLMNQVNASPFIDQFLRGQLLSILAGAQANLAVSKPATLALLNQFITVVISSPPFPFPYGIDLGTAAFLSASAQSLIASIYAGH